MKSRDELENKNNEWDKIMRAFYKEGHVKERQNVINLITKVPEKTVGIRNILNDEIEMV